MRGGGGGGAGMRLVLLQCNTRSVCTGIYMSVYVCFVSSTGPLAIQKTVGDDPARFVSDATPNAVCMMNRASI